jgi:hypothetical protein
VLQQALLSVVLPSTVAGLILLFAWRPWSKAFRDVSRTARRSAGWAAPAAIGLAFLISFFFEQGLPDIPPRERWEWLFPLVAAATIIGILVELVGERRDVTLAGTLIIAAMAGWMLRLPDHAAWFYRMGLAAVIIITIWMLLPVTTNRHGPLAPFVFALTFFAATPLFNEAAFLKLTVIMTAVGGGALAMAIVALLARKSFTLGPGALIVLVTLLHGMLLTSKAYAPLDPPMPGMPYALLALAPAALWLAEVPIIAHRRPWVRAAAGLLATIVVLGASGAALSSHIAEQRVQDADDASDEWMDYSDLG